MSIQCLKCRYSVTEPICSDCVIKEVKYWIFEQKIEKNIFKKINSEIKSFSNQIEKMNYVILPSKNIWETRMMKCIKCKKGMHLMCFYCVNNTLLDIIKSNLTSKSSKGKFYNSFNTHLYDYKLNRSKQR